jgi:hypothetical protein
MQEMTERILLGSAPAETPSVAATMSRDENRIENSYA